MKNFAVTALGEALIDFTPYKINGAAMPVLEQNPGGAPANLSAAAARLGKKAAFIGKLGADNQGNFLKKQLSASGVDIRGIVTDPSVYTTLAFVELSEAGDRSFSFARRPGADTQLKVSEVNTDLLKDSEIFHIGSLSLTDEPARSATLYALEVARNSGAIISYDPNYRPLLWESREAAKLQIRSVLDYVDIAKCSDEETDLMVDETDPELAVRRMLELGMSCAVITLGADGALAATKDGIRHIPGFSSHVVDTTGAGDSFWGAVLTRMADEHIRPEQMSLDQLADFCKFGNATASLCVEKRGAIPAMPSRSQVLDRMAGVI